MGRWQKGKDRREGRGGKIRRELGEELDGETSEQMGGKTGRKMGEELDGEMSEQMGGKTGWKMGEELDGETSEQMGGKTGRKMGEELDGEMSEQMGGKTGWKMGEELDGEMEQGMVGEQGQIIVCDELVKIYRSEEIKVMALQGLELDVRQGEMLAIIGKSGSGKSTLLNMIGGLETPSAGKLYVKGRDLASYSPKEMEHYRKESVGFVWQNSGRNLLPYLTALQNVEMPMCFAGGERGKRRRRALSLLEEVGMLEHAGKFPPQLSGGEQQRVAIAAALANDPAILLADEPTGAVDTETANRIFGLFHELNSKHGLTILIVTHDMGLADKVDRTVMISDGKISTEKVRKKKRMTDMIGNAHFTDDVQEEYVVLDRAHRLQLSEGVLQSAGIETNKVRVEVVDGKVVITQAEP